MQFYYSAILIFQDNMNKKGTKKNLPSRKNGTRESSRQKVTASQGKENTTPGSDADAGECSTGNMTEKNHCPNVGCDESFQYRMQLS